MGSKTFGYMRVSTKEQNEDRQRTGLIKAGVETDNIVLDKLSGKDFNRPFYQELVHTRLSRGDLLIVKSIDRLGRNYEEILSEWRFITKEIGANIWILDMPLLDTRQHRDLIGTLISDIVLQLLSFVAENERTAIRERQAEGIKAAQKRGVRFGRPQKKLPDDFGAVYDKWMNKEITPQEAWQSIGLSPDQFYRTARRYRDYGS